MPIDTVYLFRIYLRISYSRMNNMKLWSDVCQKKKKNRFWFRPNFHVPKSTHHHHHHHHVLITYNLRSITTAHIRYSKTTLSPVHVAHTPIIAKSGAHKLFRQLNHIISVKYNVRYHTNPNVIIILLWLDSNGMYDFEYVIIIYEEFSIVNNDVSREVERNIYGK